jgi:penicillin amidase
MSTPEKETRDDMLRKSLVDALIELEKTRGSEIETWMWGEMHPLTIKHPFSGVSSVVDDLVNIGPYGVGGDGTTLYNTEYAFQNDLSITEGKPYQTVLGPTMRLIYDFSTPGFFYLALSTGQSGHIFSDNYDNFTPLYLEGKYAKIHTNPTHIKQNHKNLIIISRY